VNQSARAAENQAHVRYLLAEKQPAFCATLEAAVDAVDAGLAIATVRHADPVLLLDVLRLEVAR